ncbi:MAG: DUF559 domain-containing protein [Calditrichaeota bacterium]|nr:MAG: DUF559 domain-containing protein [Calditrichota bacterium]
MKVKYNPNLKQLERNLRNNSTKSEIILWRYLMNKQMRGYKFSRQKPIGKYIVDFYCNRLKLVIEIDGITHSFETVRFKDFAKTRFLHLIGFDVLRFYDNDVLKNRDGVLLVINEYIDKFEETHP